MAEEKKDSKSKVLIVVLIVVIVLLLGGGAAAFMLLFNNSSKPQTDDLSVPAITTAATNREGLKLDYEPSAVALDEDSLQRAVDEAFKKTEEGYITLDFYNEAFSSNGVDFTCKIGNSPENKYDMYCAVYLNGDTSQRVFLSGLLRPGEALETFKSETALDDGTYDAVLTLTQVADDHETLKAETSVVLKLNVSAEEQ